MQKPTTNQKNKNSQIRGNKIPKIKTNPQEQSEKKSF